MFSDTATSGCRRASAGPVRPCKTLSGFLSLLAGALSVPLLSALLTLSPVPAAHAADPATHPLSREHVNLVRVTGRKITDVVYDTEALEISADKARGIVFVKVRPGWLASGAGDVTSAFFNTETENFAVQFLVSAVPSQTLDLTPSTPDPEKGDGTMETRLALAAPLVRLEAGDFVQELKLLVRHRFEGNADKLTQDVGDISREASARTFAPLPAPEGSVLWEGFRVREVQAFVTADKLVETLVFTRVTPKASVPDTAELVWAVSGVLAAAREIRDEGRDRMQTEITLIRAREAAVTGLDAFESALTQLSGVVPARYRKAAASSDKPLAR